MVTEAGPKDEEEEEEDTPVYLIYLFLLRAPLT